MTATVQIDTPATNLPDPVLGASRRVRSDLRFLRVYVYTVKRAMSYRPHDEASVADPSAEAVVDRIERGLAGEAARYRAIGWTILALLVAPLLLSVLLWTAMYWLPVRVLWLPFERGMYGLPYLSLFEWFAYLILAAYFVVAWGYLFTSYDETSRLGTEFRRLQSATPEFRERVADTIRRGGFPRTEFVIHRSSVFAQYAALLGEDRPS